MTPTIARLCELDQPTLAKYIEELSMFTDSVERLGFLNDLASEIVEALENIRQESLSQGYDEGYARATSEHAWDFNEGYDAGHANAQGEYADEIEAIKKEYFEMGLNEGKGT